MALCKTLEFYFLVYHTCSIQVMTKQRMNRLKHVLQYGENVAAGDEGCNEIRGMA